ncbi:type II toxin-antitoxin system RelE/ParE family toxin [filamentous cyanobacterium CCP5]|nr:type II toxin-antitoxin system RelE/ParE family toxin [filamentous cyanobacterium CCP5]
MSQICRFTIPASRDLEAIIDYVAEQSGIDRAEALLQQVNAKCQRLVQFPSMGRKRDELAAGVRSLPMASYLILYRTIDQGVEVLRVVSGYQDLTALFEENDS